MINPELQKYVQTSLGDNFDPAAVKKALVSAGWNPADVDAALTAAQNKSATVKAQLPETPPEIPVGTKMSAPAEQAGPATNAPAKKSEVSVADSERATNDPVATPETEPAPVRAGRLPGKKLIAIGGAALVVLILGGAGFAFYKNGDFGGGMPDSALLANLPANLEAIDSATYDIGLSFESHPREAGAVAFNVEEYGENPRGFGAYLEDINDSYAFLPAEISVRLAAGGSVTKASESLETDAMFNAGIEVSLADFNLSAEAESLKKGSNLYFRINKFPSLFIDLSPLKGKWVVITPEDINAVGNSFFFDPSDIEEFMEQGGDRQKRLEQLRLIYSLAYAEGAVVQSAPAVSETLEDGTKTRRFRLVLVKDKVPGLYERATRELQEKYGENAIIEFDQEAAYYLASPGWSNLFDYLQGNTTFEVWLDARTGQLARTAYSVRIVPPEKIEKLKDIQYVLQFNLVLKDVNRPVTVTAPADAISWDEAEVLFTGKTRGELEESRSTNFSSARSRGQDAARISDLMALRSAISLYSSSAEWTCPDQNKIYASDQGTAAVDGTGWLPMNFFDIPSGSPIGNLPRDPVNKDGYVLLFRCGAGSSYELNAKLQDISSADLMATDGGNDPNAYETGTDLDLIN